MVCTFVRFWEHKSEHFSQVPFLQSIFCKNIAFDYNQMNDPPNIEILIINGYGLNSVSQKQHLLQPPCQTHTNFSSPHPSLCMLHLPLPFLPLNRYTPYTGSPISSSNGPFLTPKCLDHSESTLQRKSTTLPPYSCPRTPPEKSADRRKAP